MYIPKHNFTQTNLDRLVIGRYQGNTYKVALNSVREALTDELLDLWLLIYFRAMSRVWW